MPTEVPENILADAHKDVHLPRASGKFISHVFTMITGNGVSQLINVVGTLLLARLFVPEAFGSFALFVTVVSFFSVLGGARYELAIMLPERDAEAANVLLLSFLALCGICGLSLLLIGLFHSDVARLLGDAQLGRWLWAVPLALFVNALYSILCVWFGRVKRFRKTASTRVWQSLAIILGQLALLHFHRGGSALIGGWVLGQTVGTFILAARFLYDDGKFVWRSRDWAMVRESAVKYRNFPVYKAPYSFVANASSQLVFVILRVFASLNVVGFYSLAARAVYLPVTLVASSMNDVFYEKAATELKHGGLEKFVTRLLRIQVVLAAPWLVLTAFDAKLVFGAVLGVKWIPAANYAAVLAFASFMYFLTSWLDRLFDIRGHQKLSLILELTGNLFSLGGLTLALWLDPANTVTAVTIYSAAQVLYGAGWLIFAYHVAEFHLGALLLILRDAVLAISAAGLLMGAFHMVLHGWLALTGSTIVACCMTGFALRHYMTNGTVSIPKRAYSCVSAGAVRR
jgi:lipopolysaccharide exporter